jgi:hypothetical protein
MKNKKIKNKILAKKIIVKLLYIAMDLQLMKENSEIIKSLKINSKIIICKFKLIILKNILGL